MSVKEFVIQVIVGLVVNGLYSLTVMMLCRVV